MRPLALSSPCTYYAVGLSAALAFKDTLSTFQRRGALMALAFVLSCVGYCRIIDGLVTATRAVGEFHVTCSSFPWVYGCAASFADEDATAALAFVCVVAERRVAGLADLGSRDSFGCELPITMS